MADGAGGAILGWWNNYSPGSFDVYASRIDASGTELWEPGGYPVCNAPDEQTNFAMAPDHDGGGFFAWSDRRNDVNGDIYALRVERNGYWGYPSPNITAVRDVPGDQGGYVNLAWDASRLDPWPDQLITEYTVWRAIDEGAALQMAGSGARVVQSIAELDLSCIDPSEPEGVIRRGLGDGFTPYYWYLVATLEANHLTKYSMAVPTLFDSTAATSELHYFQVIAHAFGAEAYWISDDESGYSVDNLAPCPPAMLAGEQQYQPEGLQLTWDPNAEQDLLHYYIYRGTAETFVPGEGNRISCTADTTTFDDGWHWSTGYWYKVSAVDVHGNESPFAVLGPGDVTGVEEDLPAVSFLAQNYPNPFNPATAIRFGIEKPGPVRLAVYDAAGRLVRVLVDDERPAGTHTVEWNGRDGAGRVVASGVYFYKLDTAVFAETRKMILLR
jgi:hypothetical protein